MTRTISDRPSDAVDSSGEAADILSTGRLAYVAIDTGRGPLVTPVLYGVAGGHLWFVTNRNALKARVLRTRPHTACVVRAGNRAVVMTGRARLLSPTHPGDFLTSPAHLTQVPFAASSWAMRNPRQVLGFLRDGVLFPSRVMPQDMVLVELLPETTRVVDHDSSLDIPPTAAAATPDRTRRSRSQRAALPAELAGLVSSRQGVLGLSTPRGPIAVPVTWDHRRQVAVLPPGTQLPFETAPACLTLDEPVHHRPTDQRGIVLRGRAVTLDGFRTDPPSVALDTRRITYWSGFETATTDLTAR
ncbi:MAG: pyridoxamine 5'-phosphate oxidase family protein [Nocardioides sp.]|nr:pyridoxamine 5'-phosphate oxidase family protein [Nocardioides sp.]